PRMSVRNMTTTQVTPIPTTSGRMPVDGGPPVVDPLESLLEGPVLVGVGRARFSGAVSWYVDCVRRAPGTLVVSPQLGHRIELPASAAGPDRRLLQLLHRNWIAMRGPLRKANEDDSMNVLRQNN